MIKATSNFSVCISSMAYLLSVDHLHPGSTCPKTGILHWGPPAVALPLVAFPPVTFPPVTFPPVALVALLFCACIGVSEPVDAKNSPKTIADMIPIIAVFSIAHRV
jgi:hypothetical protein